MPKTIPPLILKAEKLTQIYRQVVRAHKPAVSKGSYWHYRRYEAGEPATLIDWRQSARLDKLHVRERETEAAQTLCLWLDRAPRHFEIPFYVETAYTLMLAMARLDLEDGNRVIWFDAPPHALSGAAAFEAFAGPLLPPTPSQDPLPPLTPPPHRARMVLCSDFSQENLEVLAQRLRLYMASLPRLVFLHLGDSNESVRALATKCGAPYLPHALDGDLPETFEKLVAALETRF